jgi:adenosine deaminase
MMSEPDATWVAGLPKVELHVHLEGAILPATLLRLAKRNGVALPAATLEELQAWYRFRDFPHFAEIYQVCSRAIVSAEDLYEVAGDFLAEQRRQNIRHSEATFTALTHYRNNGLPFAEQIAAIGRAAREAREADGTSLGLIIDIPRDLSTKQEAMMVAEWVAEAHGDGLVLALGLAGYEPGQPPEDYAAPFALAREAGVPAVVHGGETGPAAYVRDAIEVLGAVRVGHGVTAHDDAYTLDLAKERGTIFEVCPTSNVRINLFADLASHPFDKLHRYGVAVTINTDDPPMFNTDLNGEYARLAETFGYSRADLGAFAARAARASLLPPVQVADLLQQIEAYPL